MNPTRYQKIQQALARRQPDLTVLTEYVHKPHNLAAIIRTCDAVGIFEIHTVNVVKKVISYKRVARGCDKWVNVYAHSDMKTAVDYLKRKKFKIYAAHFTDDAQDYRQIDYTQPMTILLGSEKWGVSQETATLADGNIIIPMMGMVSSLNVSVAAGIILFEAQRQRLDAGLYDRFRLDPKIYQQMIFEYSYPEIADIYQKKGEPYPPLGENGELLINQNYS